MQTAGRSQPTSATTGHGINTLASFRVVPTGAACTTGRKSIPPSRASCTARQSRASLRPHRGSGAYRGPMPASAIRCNPLLQLPSARPAAGGRDLGVVTSANRLSRTTGGDLHSYIALREWMRVPGASFSGTSLHADGEAVHTASAIRTLHHGRGSVRS